MTAAIPLQQSPEWYAWRRGGIGASEFPAILGEDPWKGERQIALEKRGEVEPEPETAAQRWGKRLQRAALEVYAESSPVPIHHVNTTAVSRRYPHVFASLDGRYVGQRRGVEVKLTREQWDEPPRRVVIQTQVQMGVLELDAIDVVKVSLGYSEPQSFTVERDDLAIAKLLPLGEAWYRRFVLGDRLPPIDGSRATSRHLDRIMGPPEMEPGPDEIALALELHRIRQAKKRLEEVEEPEAANRLKDAMHGSYAMAGGGVRVTWKPEKARLEVNHEGIAAAYRAILEQMEYRAEDLDAIVSLHSATIEGRRPLKVALEEARE